MLEVAAMTRKSAHDPRAIANKILEICDAEGLSVTIMQLIKLVYLSDGWATALLGHPLSKHDPQAWQRGPVYPAVYNSFRKFGSRPITEKSVQKSTGIEFSSSFSDREMDLLRTVVASYGEKHAFALSDMTHKPGTPWTETMTAEGQYAPIPLEKIETHFGQLANERGIKRL